MGNSWPCKSLWLRLCVTDTVDQGLSDVPGLSGTCMHPISPSPCLTAGR